MISRTMSHTVFSSTQTNVITPLTSSANTRPSKVRKMKCKHRSAPIFFQASQKKEEVLKTSLATNPRAVCTCGNCFIGKGKKDKNVLVCSHLVSLKPRTAEKTSFYFLWKEATARVFLHLIFHPRRSQGSVQQKFGAAQPSKNSRCQGAGTPWFPWSQGLVGSLSFDSLSL